MTKQIPQRGHFPIRGKQRQAKTSKDKQRQTKTIKDEQRKDDQAVCRSSSSRLLSTLLVYKDTQAKRT